MIKRVFVLLLLWHGVISNAQTETPPPIPLANSSVTAGFQVDNNTPLLGEPFTVTLHVEAPSETEILNWPQFDPPMVVLDEGDVRQEPYEREGFSRFVRQYEVVLWEVGEYLSPGVLLTFEIDDVLNSVAVSSFYVQVPTQIINLEDTELRPSVAPINLPYLSPSIPIGIGGIATVVVMLVARLIQVSRRGMAHIVTASPADKAIAELEDLKEQQLPSDVIYELVANHLRQYLKDLFMIDAIEMTTVEVMDALRQHALFDKAHRRRLQSVLEQADLVKFARFQPDNVSSFRLINYAIKWLKETERNQTHE